MKCLRRLLKNKLRLKIKKSENSEVHKIDFVRADFFYIYIYFNCHTKNRIAEMAEYGLEALGSIPIRVFLFCFYTCFIILLLITSFILLTAY